MNQGAKKQGGERLFFFLNISLIFKKGFFFWAHKAGPVGRMRNQQIKTFHILGGGPSFIWAQG